MSPLPTPDEVRDEQRIMRLATEAARQLLAGHIAAALADPGVHPHAKSLAGYLLGRLDPNINETGSTAAYGA